MIDHYITDVGDMSVMYISRELLETTACHDSDICITVWQLLYADVGYE
jgi:hypothetical protein